MKCALCRGIGVKTGNLGTGTLLTAEGSFAPNVCAEWACADCSHRWWKLNEESVTWI